MQPIQDSLFEQMTNEIRAFLKQINETYKDLFHCNVLTMADLGDMRCDRCHQNETKCVRCVVAYEHRSDKA